MLKFQIFFCALCLVACTSAPTAQPEQEVTEINGEAQGSTYSIKYLGGDSIFIHKAAIDSVLRVIDLSLSSWVPESVISTFNTHDTLVVDDPHFLTVFQAGKEISLITEGAFHPMVAPLVRAWGFGPEGGRVKDGFVPEALLDLVSFDMHIDTLEPGVLRFRKNPGMQLDVNSYAQGYAVDVVMDYLAAKGVRDAMVEIGGEVAARGLNARGKAWRIGVDRPVAPGEQRELQAAVALLDAALATSGTYRKFYEKDGRKYSHTIDPKTGYPVDHNLLSVTVMAATCMEADAYATAFLVKGMEGTLGFLRKHPERKLEVYLIYDDAEGNLGTYTSKGWQASVEEFYGAGS